MFSSWAAFQTRWLWVNWVKAFFHKLLWEICRIFSSKVCSLLTNKLRTVIFDWVIQSFVLAVLWKKNSPLRLGLLTRIVFIEQSIVWGKHLFGSELLFVSGRHCWTYITFIWCKTCADLTAVQIPQNTFPVLPHEVSKHNVHKVYPIPIRGTPSFGAQHKNTKCVLHVGGYDSLPGEGRLVLRQCAEAERHDTQEIVDCAMARDTHPQVQHCAEYTRVRSAKTWRTCVNPMACSEEIPHACHQGTNSAQLVRVHSRMVVSDMSNEQDA